MAAIINVIAVFFARPKPDECLHYELGINK